MSAGEYRPAEPSHVLTDLGQNLLTLEPLRTHGPDSLVPDGVPSIVKVILHRITLCGNNGLNDVTIYQADDLFDSALPHGLRFDLIPLGTTITQAVFEIQFTDSPIPRSAEVLPPNTLNLQKVSDSQPVCCWLAESGFIIPACGSPEGSGALNARTVALP
jgi:hypothetical protein